MPACHPSRPMRPPARERLISDGDKLRTASCGERGFPDTVPAGCASRRLAWNLQLQRLRAALDHHLPQLRLVLERASSSITVAIFWRPTCTITSPCLKPSRPAVEPARTDSTTTPSSCSRPSSSVTPGRILLTRAPSKGCWPARLRTSSRPGAGAGRSAISTRRALALAHDVEARAVADAARGEPVLRRARVGHLVAVDRHDHVAGLAGRPRPPVPWRRGASPRPRRPDPAPAPRPARASPRRAWRRSTAARSCGPSRRCPRTA